MMGLKEDGNRRGGMWFRDDDNVAALPNNVNHETCACKLGLEREVRVKSSCAGREKSRC